MPKEKFDFKIAYKKLEEITTWFEKDDIDLENGIAKFEEGAELVKDLKKYLESQENKIRELKQ